MSLESLKLAVYLFSARQTLSFRDGGTCRTLVKIKGRERIEQWQEIAPALCVCVHLSFEEGSSLRLEEKS